LSNEYENEKKTREKRRKVLINLNGRFPFHKSNCFREFRLFTLKKNHGKLELIGLQLSLILIRNQRDNSFCLHFEEKRERNGNVNNLTGFISIQSTGNCALQIMARACLPVSKAKLLLSFSLCSAHPGNHVNPNLLCFPSLLPHWARQQRAIKHPLLLCRGRS